MKELLTFLISEIIGTDDFSVSETADNDRVTLNVSANSDIVGLIIGKEGKTIKSLRKILSIMATNQNKVVTISVN